MNRVRLALIGCGEVTAEKHLPTIKKISEIELTAVCDLDKNRARAAAAKFGVARHSDDANEIFALRDVDAVGVLTDPGSHADLAIGAIRAGKHVLVEKPLALTPQDCARMIKEANARSVITMTGFHMRFHRLVRQARELIRQGQFGAIESVRVVWHSPRKDEGIAKWKTRRTTGGGAIVEIGVHHFDLIRFLLESEFDQIHALHHDGVRDDEAAVIMARMKNGALISGVFSERSPHQIEIVVSGPGGLLRLDCQRFDGLEIRKPNEAPGNPAVRLRSLVKRTRSLPIGLATMRQGGDYRISYEGSWRHFACVKANDRKLHSKTVCAP
jgi:myo-inositol 2-dehydrogenase / D-chiro-inositol 1-dehydrogenase